MRITIVIGAFLPMPPAATGAIEKVWHQLAGRFVAAGHGVTIICPRSDHERAPEMTSDGARRVLLSRRQRSGSTTIDLMKDLVYSCAAWRRLPEADITVTNCFWLPTLLRLGRRSRAGVLNIHAQRFPKGQYRLYRGAERISTVSEPIAAAIREQAPDLSPIIRVIPNPVDLTVFHPDGPTDRDPAQPTILYTGRIHPEKGLHLLVEAFVHLRKELPALRLSLVGPSAIASGGGGPAYLARLHALAGGASIDVSPNIADPQALARRLRSADAYCYPSVAYFGEASPVAPLEAMACGAVPVVSDLPQFGGYVLDGETGLTFPREATDAVSKLVAQLRVVLCDRARAASLRQAGLAKAREFSVDRIAAAHLSDFTELITQRTDRAARAAPRGRT